ncbi:TPA: radial spoke protein [Trebouxia sp. C0005]
MCIMQILGAQLVLAEASSERLCFVLLQETDTQTDQPSLLRGQTRSETEAHFVQVFQSADSDLTGMISRQDFKACLQSHELALCRKDVNVVLGEVEDGPIEYQTLAESVYQVLATRLENELLLNENLASSKALSQHLVQMLQQQDSQRMGSISLARLVQTLRTLSQDCLGLTIICLACIIGCTASDTTDSVPYKQWAGPAAAMMYSMLDPKIASARHAALTEFRGRDESERNRSVNVQSTKDCLLQAYQESDQSGSGHLTKQKCKLVIKGPASDLLHLSPQESVALQSVVEGNASDKIACDDFVGQCSQVLVQLEEEEYMFQYIQAHT